MIKKVEPWNSVKVTVNIPKEAAERLKALAQQNDGAALRNLGIMSLQMEGISLFKSLTVDPLVFKYLIADHTIFVVLLLVCFIKFAALHEGFLLFQVIGLSH